MMAGGDEGGHCSWSYRCSAPSMAGGLSGVQGCATVEEDDVLCFVFFSFPLCGVHSCGGTLQRLNRAAGLRGGCEERLRRPHGAGSSGKWVWVKRKSLEMWGKKCEEQPCEHPAGGEEDGEVVVKWSPCIHLHLQAFPCHFISIALRRGCERVAGSGAATVNHYKGKLKRRRNHLHVIHPGCFFFNRRKFVAVWRD